MRLWLIIGVVVLAVGGSVGGWYAANLLLPGQGGVSGKADIGGPFTLVNQKGETVTEEALKGQLSLINFGYTYCPDVCPTALSTMSQAMDILGDEGETVLPVFVTVDPARDTVEQMAAYAAHFHPRLLALTGTEEQTSRAAKAYRIYYAKVEDGNASEYLMDHSALFYLMDENGEFLTHFNHMVTPEEMAEGIKAHL